MVFMVFTSSLICDYIIPHFSSFVKGFFKKK
uniref:Uncharacterized protein n=1 Tax=Siphoviridae sp. ctBCr48 TaxID=2827802 RepID=A0A8S5SHA2_9CAUD|nr:MAG TPA: hypothetical protein [Siphoviridae sp. ctBCr48]